MRRTTLPLILLLATLVAYPPTSATGQDTSPDQRSGDATRERAERDRRMDAIHAGFVFADIHAHPSRFHRANVERIEAEEIERYRRGRIDVVVANISSDAAYQGGYTTRDGERVPRLRGNDVHDIRPGEPFAFTLDRLERILATVEAGDAVLATSPLAVLDAKARGEVALLAALEGADGLEGSLENLRELHRRGVRLVQLVHFVDNDIGHNQTAPYSEGGLSAFGRDLVREANRLGIIVDLAHANSRTIADALQVSEHPMLFSHTGVKARHDADRYLPDHDIRAIADAGGVIGIWPAAALGTIDEMVAHIDHVKQLVGIDHIGIASDLRGMSYIDAFGDEANFDAIVDGLIDVGYTDAEIGKVMGGNFFRVWWAVAARRSPQDPGLQVGTGTFDFTDSEGARRNPVRVWYHRPAAWTPDAPVVFVMHGNGRNADDYHEVWVPFAEQYGFLLVTPEFSEYYYDESERYHQGNILTEEGAPVDSARWSFVTLERIWDEVKRRGGSTRDRYRIYGHSAGSQFVHRLLWMMPEARIEAAVPANAGWYTMPVLDIEYPYGLGGVSDTEAFRTRLTAAFGLPVTVLLGEADTLTMQDDLRRTPEAMAQGVHRLERGRTFFETARRQADRLGVPFRWEIRTVPGAGHSNRQMAPAAAAILAEQRTRR